ncbi:glutaredoxin family protein [Colwellia piezophila]|uniref:glutaredoxin family protein n=1 Tax=Colwellia piezophila TaxID=211668 RepID=UPI00038156CB|nr:glutaredoxin family protein [Colwellia piezophila]
MKRVVLYSSDKCPHCQTAKRYLEQQGITFRLCNVKTAQGQKEFALTRLRGVPVLKVGDQLLNGFSVKTFEAAYQGS